MTPLIPRQNLYPNVQSYNNLPSFPNTKQLDSKASNASGICYSYGERISKLQACIQEITKLHLPEAECFNRLYYAINDPVIFNMICCVVAQAMEQKDDCNRGKQILQENFYCILSIRDENRMTILDKILEFYTSNRETHGAITQLSFLGSVLAQIHDPASKERALQIFYGLNSHEKGNLCRRLWELDNSPPGDPEYGLHLAIGAIERVSNYKGCSPLMELLAERESAAESIKTFSFRPAVTYSEHIRSSEDSEIKGLIRTIHLLQDLETLTKDPKTTQATLVLKYQQIDPSTRELLNKIVAVASYQPEDNAAFGENILKSNMRWLSKTQNKAGATILTQLIPHCRAKLQVKRTEKEINGLMSAPGKVTGGENLHQRYSEVLIQSYFLLSQGLQNALAYQIWWNNGGKNNPHFGEMGYGENQIKHNPFLLNDIAPNYLLKLKEKCNQSDKVLLQQLAKSRQVPEKPLDVSTDPLEKEPGLIDRLPENVRLAVVTAEYIAGIGGLKPAVIGMVDSFGANHVRVITPLYRGTEDHNGHLSADFINSMKETDHKLGLAVDDYPVIVRKAKINGVRCYFIDHSCFKIPPKPNGSAGNFYEGAYHTTRIRWAVFQKAAAELCYAFSKKNHPVELVHCHDGQTALVPRIMKQQHLEEWHSGKTPTVHFTYHNNAEPMEYNHEVSWMLPKMSLPNQGTNSFIAALEDADVKSTVSPQFGKESQMNHKDFGKGLDYHVRKVASDQNLFGVVNGSTMSCDPRKSVQLENWKSVLPGMQGQKPDLRLGPDTDPRDFAEKLRRSQRELCTYLKNLDFHNPAYAELDPEKPIVLFISRYDSGQKGIGKLPLIMQETLAQGGQFVCIGIEPDPEAKRILDDMKKFAYERGKREVLVLEDNKVGGKLEYQSVFGDIARLAAPILLVPSNYEPCGLIQLEGLRNGKRPLVSWTGGLKDTVYEEGPNANGHVFERCEDWHSPEQDRAIVAALTRSLTDAKGMQRALYRGIQEEIRPYIERSQRIMRHALDSTWEYSPDGLSPIRKRELIDAEGFRRRTMRGGAGYVQLQCFDANQNPFA